MVMKYVCGIMLLLSCSLVQAMQKSLEAPKSPLRRCLSEPSLNAVFIRSGSHDNILIDVHHPLQSRSSSPTQFASASMLEVPLLAHKQKQENHCKLSVQRLGKGVKLVAMAAILLVCFYAADQMYSASSQLKDGATEISDQLQGVKDDVALVRDMFTMCKHFVRECLPCLPQGKQE